MRCVGHQELHIGQRLIGMDGERVNHHAGLVFFDTPNLRGLFLRRHVLVDNADAAELCHGDGHFGFRDGVHGGGDQWDV